MHVCRLYAISLRSEVPRIATRGGDTDRRPPVQDKVINDKEHFKMFKCPEELTRPQGWYRIYAKQGLHHGVEREGNPTNPLNDRW
jgi:hypothetical protein